MTEDERLPDSPSTIAYDAGEVAKAASELVRVYKANHDDYYWQVAPEAAHSADMRLVRRRLLEASTALYGAKAQLRRAINQLLIPTMLCIHCDETEVVKGNLCEPCRKYKSKYGHLPSDETLSKRYGWPQS